MCDSRVGLTLFVRARNNTPKLPKFFSLTSVKPNRAGHIIWSKIQRSGKIMFLITVPAGVRGGTIGEAEVML